MSFVSINLPAIAVRWRLEGPAGPRLDILVAGLIGAGVSAEPIAPGTAYRLKGSSELLASFGEKLAAKCPEYVLKQETAPDTTVRLSTRRNPPTSYSRSVTVHGTGPGHSDVARAVDRGLDVSSVGLQRWRVTGRTAALAAWVGEIYKQTPEQALEMFGITAAIAAEEDAPVPVVTVKLPDREIASVIERNRDGDIVKVTQTEKTPK